MVADHKFLFTLNLTDPAGRDAMLNEVASNLLGHVGYQQTAAAAIIGHLRGAVAAAVAGGCRDCSVQFFVESGELLIIVLHDGLEWRTTRPLP